MMVTKGVSPVRKTAKFSKNLQKYAIAGPKIVAESQKMSSQGLYKQARNKKYEQM